MAIAVLINNSPKNDALAAKDVAEIALETTSN